MAYKKNNSSAYKKRNYTPSNKTEENKSVTNEFCALNNTIGYSELYFGFNIFDMYDSKKLAHIVKDPITNNDILREISLVLYGMNGTFTNAVDYMTAMPTLDNVIISRGKNKANKNKNKALMEATLRLIKHKEIIRDALFKGMIEGTAFYYFETTQKPNSLKKTMNDYEVDSIVEINDKGLNASIISLPNDYTRIVGLKNNCYVLAFNLDYFNEPDGESTQQKLRKFPKEIREAYKNKTHNINGNNWVVLDCDKTIVHKIKSKREEPWGRPLVLAAIRDILYGDYFTDTKRGVLDEINNRIIYETFPEGKEKGTSALTKTQQENQHNAVKSAVMQKNNRGGVSFFSVAAGTKINSIDSANTDIFDSKNEASLNDRVALGLGVASALLNGVGSGTYASQINNLELLSAQLFQWIEQIESELNKCIAKNIIKDSLNPVECKYLKITHINKKEMVGFAKDLYLQGCGSLSLWAASCGVSPDIFFALLDKEKEDGVYDKYTPHPTSYTLSSKDNDFDFCKNNGGRPVTDNPTENTMNSRENNGNNIPSPSD